MLHGTLTVLAGVPGGLTSGDISNNGSGTVTLTGTVAEINATLAAANGLVYREQGDHTSDTLTVATQDQGTTPLLTATSTVPITVTEVPVITVPGAQTLDVNEAMAVAGVGVSEIGNTSGEIFKVTLTDAHGHLSANTSLTGGGGTITGSGTRPNYQWHPEPGVQRPRHAHLYGERHGRVRPHHGERDRQLRQQRHSADDRGHGRPAVEVPASRRRCRLAARRRQ